jgi:hypothetical protein
LRLLHTSFSESDLACTLVAMENDSAALLIFGSLLAVAGIGLAKTLKPGCVSPVVPGGRTMLVGDSLGVGMAPYFAKLSTDSGMDYVARTTGGTQTFQWAGNTELATKVQSFQPTLCLVSLGTNDAKGNRTADQLSNDIQSLIGLLSSTGATVVWILPHPLPFDERGFSDLVRATGVRVYESSKVDLPLGPDAIHMSGTAYAYWAAMVWRELMCDTTSPEPVRPTSGLGYSGRVGFLARRG